MNNLTADKCRELLKEGLRQRDNGDISIAGNYTLQALEIALPILEQQDHEKSIIAGQLEAVRDSLSLTPHQHAIISCAIDRINVLTSRTLELSRSLIKQQEQGDGWIEWGGGDTCPVELSAQVELKSREGQPYKSWPACMRDWRHEGIASDIIAYRIIPEQPTNQNGEQ